MIPILICVDLAILFHKILIPLMVMKIIVNLYKKNTIDVQVNGEMTAPIDTTTGIRQGDLLSPLSFNLI